MTTYAAAASAIKAHLRSGWQATPIFDGWEPAEEPDPPEPFVKIHVRGQRGRALEIGNPAGRSLEIQGTAHVVLFVPVGSGDDLALDYATMLEALFSLAEIGTGEGRVRCDVAEIGEPVPADEERRWRSITIRVPFTHFGRAAAA